eukprot:COSAG06_NODE_29508_length_555_cov_0.899123_2_plen_21_part_01
MIIIVAAATAAGKARRHELEA